MSMKDFFTRISIRLLRLFAEKTKADTSVKIPWEDAVEMLYDKQLDNYIYEVIKVIYSADKSMRYVILRDDKGLFSYELQAIYPYDENAKNFVSLRDGSLSAQWEPFVDRTGRSFFENQKELFAQIEHEPEFKKYFI